MSTTAVVSTPSAAPAAPSAAPAAAPKAPASSQSAPQSAPQGASKPPAPSQPAPVANSAPQRQGRQPRQNDPLKAALDKATAAARAEAQPADPAPAAPAPAKPQPSPQDAAKAALSTAAPTAQPSPEPQPQAPNPMAELEHLRRSSSDAGRQMKAMQQELAQMRQDRDQQAKAAELAKLKPYHSGHPDHASTMSRIQKAEAFDAAVRGSMAALPPEQQTPAIQNAIRQNTAREMGVRNEDLALRDEWKAHKEQVSQQMAADPDGFIRKQAEIVAKEQFQTMLQQHLQEQQIHQEVQRDLSDPMVQRYAQERPEEFRQAVQDLGGRTEYVAHMVKLHNANQQLLARIAELEKQGEVADRQVGMAAEQQRLLKGRATIQREPASKTVIDPLAAARARAKELGIPASMTHPRFRELVDQFHTMKHKQPNA